VLSGIDSLGMITGASWSDVDGDGWPDLVVTGEWMSPKLFLNKGGKFKQAALTDQDGQLSGLWSSIRAADLNGDGYPDLLLGNYGLNSKLQADSGFPMKLFVVPPQNGQVYPSQILAIAKQGKYYPFLSKVDLEKPLPYLKKQFLSYEKMAGLTAEDIFGDLLRRSKELNAATLASIALLNDGKGHFSLQPLPAVMQWSPVFSFADGDFNGDGKSDLVTGGNFYGTVPFEGRYDAMALSLAFGDGKGRFKGLIQRPAALLKTGEVRDIRPILVGGSPSLLVARNNDSLQFLKILNPNFTHQTPRNDKN